MTVVPSPLRPRMAHSGRRDSPELPDFSLLKRLARDQLIYLLEQVGSRNESNLGETWALLHDVRPSATWLHQEYDWNALLDVNSLITLYLLNTQINSIKTHERVTRMHTHCSLFYIYIFFYISFFFIVHSISFSFFRKYFIVCWTFACTN